MYLDDNFFFLLMKISFLIFQFLGVEISIAFSINFPFPFSFKVWYCPPVV